jgi:murein DD-endopeptidase MepM/ murein hydrolase activator NlpD
MAGCPRFASPAGTGRQAAYRTRERGTGPRKSEREKVTMHQRGARAWVAATILATLLLPAVGSIADPQEDLHKTERQLGDVQSDIQAHESQADTLKAEAAAINANMISLRRDLDQVNAGIAKVESQVRTAQARIDRTQAEIDTVHDLATEQAVALYKQGQTEAINALLDSSSLTELDNRVEMLGVAAQENTGALVEYGRLKVEIEAQHRELFNHKEELVSIRKHQEKIYATLDSQKAQLTEKISQLQAILGKEYAHEGSLLGQQRRLSAIILERSTLHSVAILGESSQGFIWPLNGAINSPFGPRWGRMHTGIDIDGNSGDPIVASKAGRVILASYYSGYGNAIIIDHGGGFATLYGHLSAFDVRNGEDVAQGKIIGRVGCTGSCTGDHLHFEVRVNGTPVDPLDYLP